MIKTVMVLDYNKLRGAGPKVQRFASGVVRKTAHDIEADAKDRAPVDTGNLVANIRAEPQGDLAWAVTSYAEYGAAVEYGTPPHEIRPRNAQALFWPGAAHPVKVVHHPGTPPQPYLTPAAENQREPFRRAMAQIERAF